MAANRIMRGGATSAGTRLRVALAVLVLAATLAGCGGGVEPSATAAQPDSAADGAILNRILARQEAAVEAYQDAMRLLREPFLPLARRFQAQEEEHVDATLKELRAIGEVSDPRPQSIVARHLRSQKEALSFLYEVERATIEAENRAVGELTTPSARTLLAATMANQAQHLVWLRRALGATPGETVPAPFEDGSVPAP